MRQSPDYVAWHQRIEMLRAIADGSVYTVEGLAQACGAEVAELRPVLVQLHERGWVTVPPGSDAASV
jgi:transcription initiation factor IIE alpha subunit